MILTQLDLQDVWVTCYNFDMYVEVQGFENISRRFLNLTKIVLCDVIATADLIAPM